LVFVKNKLEKGSKRVDAQINQDQTVDRDLVQARFPALGTSSVFWR